MRRAHPIRLMIALVAIVVFGAACGDSASSGATQSVTSDDLLTKIEIPSDWDLYSSNDLAGITETPFVSQVPIDMPVVSRFVFDGSPTSTADTLTQPIANADFPVGSSVVRRISPDVKDFVSRYLLAEVVVPYHNASASEELLKQDIDFGDDFEGVQLMVVYRDDETSADAGVFLISLTDPEVTTLYQVAVGCSIECFNTYAPVITEVVDSWLVNTRG